MSVILKPPQWGGLDSVGLSSHEKKIVAQSGPARFSSEF